MIKVTHRKLGKHKAIGLAWVDEKHIEIDANLKSSEQLYVIIHETLHILNPKWSELKIIHQARKITEVLWNERYRRVESL